MITSHFFLFHHRINNDYLNHGVNVWNHALNPNEDDRLFEY